METNPTNNLNKLPRGLIGRRGLPIARGTRLPSLRGPRDLTLGGAVKRVFAPNIPQRRERSKDNETNNTNKSPTKPPRHRRCRSGEHGRGRGRGRVELIQTQGAVFGDGLADLPSKSASGFNHENSSRDRINSNKISSSKPKAKREERRSEEERELLRDDFIDYDDDNKDDDGDQLYPVVLPAGSGADRFRRNYKKKKQWIRIKVESDEESDSDASDNLSKKGVSVQTTQEDLQKETAKLFSSLDIPKSGKLIFFQFPNCLPGLADKDDHSHRNRTDANAESPASQRKISHSKKMKATSKCGTLADWPEGYLGKLRICRSGKTYLDVGSLVLDVQVGTSIEFLQDLASVRAGRGSGAMTVLGQVREKVVCVPGMDSLLAACS